MDFMELMKERYSVRKYKDQQIEPEKLDQILEAARVAPTACNNQPQRIYVLQSEEAITKIRGITKFAFNAPTVFLIGYDAEEDWRNPFESGIHSGEQDVSIVATQMMLEAWSLGIGSCWVNGFSYSKAVEAFGIPANIRLVLAMPMGYAADDSKPAPGHGDKKNIQKTVQYL